MIRRVSLLTRVEEYLAFRRSLGFSLKGSGDELRRFAKHADGAGHRGPLTTDLITRWAIAVPNGSRPNAVARFNVVRVFAKHLSADDPRTEVPPRGLLGPTFGRSTPHIYSMEEISSLLLATAAMPSRTGLRPSTYTTLFGLLSATGLRVNEALRLAIADVDLREGVLNVVKTKGHRERLVPLHPTTTAALRRYESLREARLPARTTSAFFVTERGTGLTYPWVTRNFGRLRAQLGWQSNPRPRIHDLRHTFAVRNLLRWSKAGKDVHAKVCLLAAYLGHVNVTNTYWYLSAVPELMAVTGERFGRFAADTRGTP